MPVVHPEPKVRHDLPTGCYLKHWGDGAEAWGKGSPHSSPLPPVNYSSGIGTSSPSTGGGGPHVRVVPIEIQGQNEKLNQAMKQVSDGISCSIVLKTLDNKKGWTR